MHTNNKITIANLTKRAVVKLTGLEENLVGPPFRLALLTLSVVTNRWLWCSVWLTNLSGTISSTNICQGLFPFRLKNSFSTGNDAANYRFGAF